MRIPGIEQAMHLLDRAERVALGPIAVLFGRKVGFKYRFQNQFRRRLCRPITDRGNGQGAKPRSTLLRYVDSSGRLRLVRLFLQLLRQFPEPSVQPIRFNVFEPFLVNPRRAAIGFAAVMGVPENVLSMHFVVQRIESKARVPLRFGMERRLQLLNTRRSYQVTQSPVPRCFLRSSRTEVPSLHRRYPTSAVLRTSPPPRHARPVPRGRPVDRRVRSRDGVSRVAPVFLLHTCRRQYPGGIVRVRPSLASPTMTAFPEIRAGRLPHHPFRGLLSVYSRYGLRTRQVPCRTLYTEGFSRFVTSTTAPIATGWSDSCRVGFAPTETPCLCTAHRI